MAGVLYDVAAGRRLRENNTRMGEEIERRLKSIPFVHDFHNGIARKSFSPPSFQNFENKEEWSSVHYNAKI